jgi:hypothetical protein
MLRMQNALAGQKSHVMLLYRASGSRLELNRRRELGTIGFR